MADRWNSRVGASIPYGGSRGDFEAQRRSSRSLIAGIVAGGLALSASLYPTPGELPIIGRLDSPGIGAASEIADRLGAVISTTHVAFDEAAVTTLLHVAKVFMEHPNIVSVDTLLTLTETYGVQNVLQSFETIAVTADILRTHTDVFNGGGGGGGGGAQVVLPNTLSEWMLLLGMLINRLPGQFLDTLSHAIARLVPELVDPVAFRRLVTIVAAEAPIEPPTPLPAPVQTLLVAPSLAADVPGPATPLEEKPAAPQSPPPPPLPQQGVETVVVMPTTSAVPAPIEAPPTSVTETPLPPVVPTEESSPVSTVTDSPETAEIEEPDLESGSGELDDGEVGGAPEQGNSQPSSAENSPNTAPSNPIGTGEGGDSTPAADDGSPSGVSTSG
jgi:hypothetical protein